MSYFKKEIFLPNEAEWAERIREIVSAEDGQPYGLAEADIIRSAPHRHKETRETYLLVSGELDVFLGDDDLSIRLRTPGETIEIPVGIRHWARSTDHRPAKVLVTTIPPWRPDDHIVCE